jgi:hypothetical protein
MSEKRRPEMSIDDLRAEHRACEQRLTQLARHKTLTSDEQAEQVRLKKLKLAMKDRLTRLTQ